MSGYVGNGPGRGQRQAFSFTATASQTAFSGKDSIGLTLTYKPRFIDVYVNGLCIPPSEYTATDGSTITFGFGLNASDVVYVVAMSAFDVANTMALDQAGADVSNKPLFRQNIGIPTILRSYLSGLALSAAGSTATFGIAAGVANDSTNAAVMILASAYTKTTSAWAVGSGNGALDTGSIANSTWYHVFLIQRPDTSVVDVLVSTSATSPTMPTNYTLFRRIGSMKTDGSAQWVKFSQFGDEFLWDVSINNISATPGTTAIQTLTVTTPPGLKTMVILNVCGQGGAGSEGRGWIFSPDMNSANAVSSSTTTINFGQSASTSQQFSTFRVRTNTSAQIRYGMLSTTGSVIITTQGWLDRRGQDD